MRKVIFWWATFLAIGFFAASTAMAAQGQSDTGGKASAKQKKATMQAGRVLGEVEAISGTIKSVDIAESKVTITSAEIPYVFQLLKKTKIEINGQKGDLEALSKAVDKKVSLRFLARSDGNMADHIEVSS